jgi:hypothetical protein
VHLPEISADDFECVKDRLVRLAERDPECGEDFCANCGECMSCYDHTGFGSHTWMVDDQHMTPEQRASIEAAVLSETGVDIAPLYTPANSEPYQPEGYWFRPY